MRGRGTSDAIMTVTDYITRHVDNDDRCAAVFLDLSKAFDSVCHGLLLRKLRNVCIQNIIQDWFASYLTNRIQ